MQLLRLDPRGKNHVPTNHSRHQRPPKTPISLIGTVVALPTGRVRTPRESRRINMSKLTDFRVAVLATDGFEESELTEPVRALKDAGAQVTILSLKPGQIQGVHHDLDKTIKVKVDRAIA